MSNIVILGDGLLGTELAKQTGWDIISRKKDGFDITKPDNFFGYFFEVFDGMAASPKYNIILNCIGNTDTYSNDKEKHWNINYKGVVDLTDFCLKWKIKLVHVSTDFVYTNSKKNASETDVPIHGDNWYSYTKLLADAYVQLKSKDNLICVGTHKPYPFPYKQAWIDQEGNFDYVDVISSIIIKLIQTNADGVFNIGTELKTMYDLASKYKPVNPAMKPRETPLNTSIDTTKLKNWLYEKAKD